MFIKFRSPIKAPPVLKAIALVSTLTSSLILQQAIRTSDADSTDTPSLLKELSTILDDAKRSLQVEATMLGEQWGFRKAIIDAIGSLAKQEVPFGFGSKLRFTGPDGTVIHICVAQKCSGDTDLAVDCSGLAEFAAHSACFANGICKSTGYHKPFEYPLKCLETDASRQAACFTSNGALEPPSGSPHAGDFLFFQATYDRNGDGVIDSRDGITHVAIYLGKTKDNRIKILDASPSQGVAFRTLEEPLAGKLVGFGNISLLYVKLKPPAAPSPPTNLRGQ